MILKNLPPFLGFLIFLRSLEKGMQSALWACYPRGHRDHPQKYGDPNTHQGSSWHQIICILLLERIIQFSSMFFIYKGQIEPTLGPTVLSALQQLEIEFSQPRNSLRSGLHRSGSQDYWTDQSLLYFHLQSRNQKGLVLEWTLGSKLVSIPTWLCNFSQLSWVLWVSIPSTINWETPNERVPGIKWNTSMKMHGQ